MSISREEVNYLAELSKLKLKESEVESFVVDLNRIIGYIEAINQLDTSGVEAMEHVLEINNISREDAVMPSLSLEDVLKNAPEKEMNCFKVPRVLE